MFAVRTARCAVLFWQDGKLVWDNYLRHNQFALTAESEGVLRWFCEWRELDSALLLGERAHAVAAHLLDAGVLIRKGSPEDRDEGRVLTEWGALGPATSYFHFAARTDSTATYLDLEADRARTAIKKRIEPPPPLDKTYPNRSLVPLSPERVRDESWARPKLVDALYGRRSTRRFTAEPISLDAVSDLVRLTGGIVATLDDSELGTAHLKTSPSAGARTPMEIYLYADRVIGLEPGLYHFSPTRNGLEAIGGPVPYDVRRAAVGQPWLADGAVLVFHTAVIARTRWRYESRRAYRDVLLELGHISQTLLLASTARGLGAVFATAVRDESLERLLGCDFASELPLGVTSIGHAAP